MERGMAGSAAGALRCVGRSRRILGALMTVCTLWLAPAQADWQPLNAGIESAAVGGHPRALALVSAPAASRLLAAGEASPSGVRLMNPDQGASLGFVATPRPPLALAFDTTGAILFALDEAGDVHRIDTAGKSILARYRPGGEPVALVYLAAPVPELILADQDRKELVRLNAATGALIQRIRLDHSPRSLALDGTGGRLIVAEKRGAVRVFNTSTWQVLANAAVGDEVRDIAWWQAGGLAVAVHKRQDGVSLVDPAAGTVAGFVPLDGDPERSGIDEAAGRAYVATRDDFSLNRVDLARRVLEGRYGLPGRTHGLVFDAATGKIILSQADEKRLLRLDPAQAGLIAVLQLQKRLRDLAVNNVTHEMVAIADKSDELTRVKLADKTTQVLSLPNAPLRVGIDSGLNRAVVAGRDRKLRFVDLAGTDPILLTGTAELADRVEALAVDSVRATTVAITSARPRLHLIDNSSLQVRSIEVPDKLSDVAVDASRGLAYAVGDGRFYEIDLAGGAIARSADLGPAEGIVVDEVLRLALITSPRDKKAWLVSLESLQVVQGFDLPRRPGQVALNPDTHVAVVASGESDAVSLVDMEAKTVSPFYASLNKPSRLAVSARFNQALALSAERDELSFIQLPNPVPKLDAVEPAQADAGAAAFRITARGSRFVDASQVRFGATPLVTRWLAAGRLEADVPANLVANAGAVAVAVVNPQPGGGESATVMFTIASPFPAPVLASIVPASAPADGQPKNLTLTGTGFRAGAEVQAGGLRLPAVVAGATQLTFTLPAASTSAPASIPLEVANPDGKRSNILPFVLTAAQTGPRIAALAPDNGPVGTPVAISGENFDPDPAKNDVRFNNERAVVAAATTNLLRVIVPVKATTGPVTVTTPQGTGTSPMPFTVKAQQDFDLALEPAALNIPRGGSATVRVKLVSTGLSPYSHGVALAVSGLPAGITWRAEPVQVSAANDAFVTFSAAADAASGAVTVSGSGSSDTTSVTRAKPLTLNVLAAGSTTVSGRVLHAEDDRPFVGARIRLGTQIVFTDVAGYYRFVDPGLTGDQVILIDGHTNNTATTEYPSAIALPAMIVAGQDNRALTSWIQAIDATKFTAIVPGAAATVTNPDLPGYALNIPAGAVLMGWNGQPIDKVSVRTVPVDRLPIKPVPEGVTAKTVYLYYFFREGGANPSVPIPVTMANDMGALPGEKADLWYYDESVTPDANSNQWRIMGQGTVSEDGKSIVSDPGVGIPKFCCGASMASPPPPPVPPTSKPKGGDDPCSTNPVLYGSGAALVMEDHSLGINSIFPVRIGCRYSSLTDRIGPFGRGTVLNTEWQLARGTGSVVLMSPDGHRWIMSKGADNIFRTQPGRAGAYGVEASFEGSLTVVRFPDGVRFEFGSFGRGNQALVAQQDINGNRIALTRNGSGIIQSVTDAAGRVYRLEYAGSLISKITDPANRTLNFTYDASSRPTQVTDAAGGTTRYDYDSANRIVKKTNARGIATTYEYDANGRAVKETFGDGSNYAFAYNIAGSMVMDTKVTDPRGNLATYRFNGLGDWTRKEDALGRIHLRRLDPANNLVLSETDAAGRVTRYTYDERGNRNSVRDPLDNLTQTLYHPRLAKPTEIIDPLGNRTRFDYDANGNLVAVTNGEGQTTRYTYTAKGALKTITDSLGNVTTYEHNAEGLPIAVIDPLGNRADLAYDGANRVKELTTPRGETARNTYDALDRLIEQTDPLLGLTRYAYDALGNLLSVTNPLNQIIERRTYDARGRLSERQDAKAARETFEYDGNGNVIRATDRRGRAITFEYDGADRPSLVSDADGRTTRYHYDLAGNISRIADSQSGDILIQYDALNRPVQVATDQGTVGYAYDALGRRTKMTVNGGDEVAYGYDRANRITAIAFRGKTSSFQYDAAGRLTQKTLPNGMTQAFEYDAANRLLSIAFRKADSTPIEQIQYAYDANGNRTEKRLGGDSLRETGFDATYDEANRLTRLTVNPGAAGEKIYELLYDAAGNLTSRTNLADATDKTTYTWDARGRLITLTGPGYSAAFQYDALGRRIGKTVNGNSVGYLYDGAQAIAELAGNAISAAYHPGIGMDEVLARHTNQGQRTLLQDALNSVIAQAKDDQTMANWYAYSPYGESQALGDGGGNPLQYTGRENDGTGLYYYRARYYDPVLKRFISEDPIGLAGGANVLAYVRGNPISLTDPEGLCPPGDVMCKIAQRNAGLPPDYPLSPRTECNIKCNFQYQLICTATGITAGMATSPLGGAIAGGGCILAKAYVCDRYCRNKNTCDANN